MNALELMPRSLRLLVIQLRGSGARQPPLRSIHNRHHHFQITQQLGAGPWRSFLLGLPLRFEKQLGIVQDAFTDRRRALAPGAIQLAGLARIAVMLGEDRRHPLAIFQALARRRHQKLHRHLRQNLALAHLLLDRLSVPPSSTTAIAEKSVVPPPMSTTRTRSPARSSFRHAAPRRSSQA